MVISRFERIYAIPRLIPVQRQWGLGADYVFSADDPSRVVTVTAQSGKTGIEVSISYTNCKVVGNGSFGVVFAAKIVGELLGVYSRRAVLKIA